MAKLFNKIRHKLVAEKPSAKRTTNYLKYAIGEIVLVVVGILIALQINTLHEAQNQKQELHNIYTIIADDLKNDINDIDKITKIYEKRKPIFIKVLEGSMTKKDYSDCSECVGIMMSFPDLSLDVRGYNLLNNYKKTSKTNKDNLAIDIVQFYTKRLNEINLNEKSRMSDFQNNFQYWKSNYSWFSDFIVHINDEGFIKYAVNSQDYKNRVGLQYVFIYNTLLKQYKNFKKEAENLIIRIEKENLKQ